MYGEGSCSNTQPHSRWDEPWPWPGGDSSLVVHAEWCHEDATSTVARDTGVHAGRAEPRHSGTLGSCCRAPVRPLCCFRGATQMLGCAGVLPCLSVHLEHPHCWHTRAPTLKPKGREPRSGLPLISGAVAGTRASSGRGTLPGMQHQGQILPQAGCGFAAQPAALTTLSFGVGGRRAHMHAHTSLHNLGPCGTCPHRCLWAGDKWQGGERDIATRSASSACTETGTGQLALTLGAKAGTSVAI